MELDVITPGHTTAKKQKVSDKLFGRDFNEPLIHQVVTAYLAGGRAGTAAQKNRSAVRGGGKKPWRQKGTGRARAGTSRGPLWRAGGVTFAATPRDYSQKVNKKMYRAAMCSILSELARLNRLKVMEAIELKEPKTKALVNALKLEEALIIVDDIPQNLKLASRNLPHVLVKTAQTVDPVSLLNFENVLVTTTAIKLLEERFK